MKGVDPAFDLIIELRDVGRQKPMQVEQVAFGVGERRAFVEQRIIEKLITAQRGLDVWRGHDLHGRRISGATIAANAANQQRLVGTLSPCAEARRTASFRAGGG